METIIFLIVVNVIVLAAFGRGATRSAAGFFRLVIAVGVAVGGAFGIAWFTGETRMSHSIASQVAALLLLLALASAATVVIATVKFATVAIAALVAIRHERIADDFRAEARKAAPTEVWSDFPAWCREVADKHEKLAEKASRWLYAE